MGGGKGFDLSRRIPWASDSDRDAKSPNKVVGFWNESLLHKSDGKSERGFGGRVYFYNEEGGKPIRVEGQLVVYAFDESASDRSDRTATRRYVFPAEQFARHYSESKLGPSYSIWLPWDDVGGGDKKISLIARFQPTHGSLIVSHQSEHRLPGSGDPARLPARGAILPASYAGASQVETGAKEASIARRGVRDPTRRMTTTSIALPTRAGAIVPRADKRNGRRLNSSGSAAQSRPSIPLYGAALNRSQPTSTNRPESPTTATQRPNGFRLGIHRAQAKEVFPQRAFRELSRPGQ